MHFLVLIVPEFFFFFFWSLEPFLGMVKALRMWKSRNESLCFGKNFCIESNFGRRELEKLEKIVPENKVVLLIYTTVAWFANVTFFFFSFLFVSIRYVFTTFVVPTSLKQGLRQQASRRKDLEASGSRTKNFLFSRWNKNFTFTLNRTSLGEQLNFFFFFFCLLLRRPQLYREMMWWAYAVLGFFNIRSGAVSSRCLEVFQPKFEPF